MRCSFLIALLLALPVQAQNYPDKPLRVLITFAPGGPADIFARMLQPKLTESLGQPLVIDNRPGASGTIAEGLLAKAAPDGYTLMMSGDSGPANAHLYRGLSYDLFRDLLPVSLLTQVPLTLIVNPAVPAASLAEFVAYARSRPGQLSYGSPGTGTISHLYVELFKGFAGIEMTHIPYKGGVPAMSDLIGGQVQALLLSVTLSAPQVRSGKVRAIARTGEKRSHMLPQVPTFTEAGYADLKTSTWTGLWLPAGTPPAIVQRLHAEFAKAAAAPENAARIHELGAEVVMSSPAEFAALLRSEHERLGKLIRERGINAN
jgi:tripartite-type tricarboxylate transporter receptor subunit TctC